MKPKYIKVRTANAVKRACLAKGLFMYKYQ